MALWTGFKPDSVLRVSLGEEATRKLEDHRNTFMLYVRGEVFMRASLVRVQAEVAGYITDKMGILEYTDEERRKKNIVFHEVWCSACTIGLYFMNVFCIRTVCGFIARASGNTGSR